MIDFTDIEINKFQLNALLNHHEKQGFKYLLQNDVWCSHCQCNNEEVSNYKLFLDRFNDIKVSAVCSECGHPIVHIMPFGENETFFRKAIQFRHKIINALQSV